MRYLPLTDTDRKSMLQKIGVEKVDDLFCHIPQSVYHHMPFSRLPRHQGELEVERIVTSFARKNRSVNDGACFLGGGAYHHHIPASVQALSQRGEFLTSYTPYQPEIMQGTLQYLFEFQTQVALLTGMEVANASMYDGAHACVEGVLMANRLTKRRRVVVSGGIHPHYIDVVKTYGYLLGYESVLASPDPEGQEDLTNHIDERASCLVVQTPSVFGQVRDFSDLAETCHRRGVLLMVVITEIVSLGLLRSPGEMGADIVVAEGQSLGNTLSFGGPYLGLFAARKTYLRQMPGRIVGQTQDQHGRTGYVLTMATREQHIRRERATSNICTNAGLCALAFTIHLSLLGETGFKRLALLNHTQAVRLADMLSAIKGVSVINESFFNEFTVRLPCAAQPIVEKLLEYRVFGGIAVSRLLPNAPELNNLLLVAVTEMNVEQDLRLLHHSLKESLRV